LDGVSVAAAAAAAAGVEAVAAAPNTNGLLVDMTEKGKSAGGKGAVTAHIQAAVIAHIVL
jgi:hypothetical protein